MGTSIKSLGVVIAARNEKIFIEECLKSILAVPEISEVIVVDDGSDDGMGLVCALLAQEDRRMRVLRTDGVGVAAARNLGLKSCTTDYVLFVDGDDLVVPSGIEKAWFQINQQDICITSLRHLSDDSRMSEADNPFGSVTCGLTSREVFSSLISSSRGSFGGAAHRVFYRRSFLVNHGIYFPPGITVAEDYCFNLRILSNNPSCIYVPESTYLYRENPASTTRNYNPSLCSSLEIVNEDLCRLAAVMGGFESETNVCVLNSVLLMIENTCRQHRGGRRKNCLEQVREISNKYRNLARSVTWRSAMESKRVLLAKIFVRMPAVAVTVYMLRTRLGI